MCVLDLHPLRPEIVFVKFADDTYIIVGADMKHTVFEENAGVKRWADVNNLRLNTGKCKEMIDMKEGRMTCPGPPLIGMERVESFKILV